MTILHSTKAEQYKYRFNVPTISDANVAVIGTGNSEQLVDNTLRLSVSAGAPNNGYIHLGRPTYDIDRLQAVEFDFFTDAIGPDATLYIGVADDISGADPTAATATTYFSTGGADGLDVLVSARDGSNTNDNVDTMFRHQNGKWLRARIDLGSGVVSISAPGKSQGGKASIQYAYSDILQHVKTTTLDRHMTMQEYSGPLDVFIGVDSGAAGGTKQVWLREICVDHEVLGE